jgi:hypothetical protein
MRILTLFAFIASILFFLPGCKTQVPSAPQRGGKWVIYTSADHPALKSNVVHCVMADRGDRIWFGTDSGATSVKGDSWSFIKDTLGYYIYSSGGGRVRAFTVNAMAEGLDASIWFGTDGGGLHRFSPNAVSRTWSEYHASDFPRTIPFDNITQIAPLESFTGDVFVVTKFGTCQFTPGQNDPTLGTWVTLASTNFVGTYVNAAVTSLTKFTICFGASQGISFYNIDNGWSPFPFPSAQTSPTNALAWDLHNVIWIGQQEGFSTFNTTNSDFVRYTSVTTGGKLPAGPVTSVTTNLGSLRWFATGSGLVQLRDTTWTTFTMDNSPLPSNTITGSALDSKGNLWIGTSNGVAEYNPDGVVL